MVYIWFILVIYYQYDTNITLLLAISIQLT